LVDALRGFALFGVLLVNLQGWVVFALPEDLAAPLRSTLLDRTTLTVVEILADSKFITLFSLLFGYGFGLILERVGAKGVAFAPFFARRMTILLAAGLLHLGWWWGEILSSYAVGGLLLLLFRGRSARALDRDLRAADRLQPRLVRALPLRPRRVAVAHGQLRPAPAAAKGGGAVGS
jgi:uncharacterized protein